MPVFDTTTPEYTVGYLIDRTFDLLLGANREELNRLTNELDATTTTFNIDFPPASLNRGTYLTIDDEIMYVWSSVTASGNSSTVTVQRGMRGSTPQPHAAQRLIFTNPYFMRYQVRQTLRDVIRSWAPQVFAVKTLDIPLLTSVRGYDLGNIGPWMFGLDLTISPSLFTGQTDNLNWKQVESWRCTQSAPLSDFPSGNALTLTDPGRLWNCEEPRTLHFTYNAPIDVDTSFNDEDDLLTMGMDSSDLDIPVYGAAAQLAMSREMRRMNVESQGEIADLQQFPPGYAVSAADKFQMTHDKRFNDAIERLRSRYPLRRIS